MAIYHHNRATTKTAADRRGSSAGRRNASVAPGCGNGGVPAPWRYQRRIDTLGPEPKRNQIWREDYRDVTAAGHAAGELTGGAHLVAMILADLSNRHGQDVTVSEAEIASRARKRHGGTYSPRWASRGLDELRAAGYVDWQHGTNAQRIDPVRRERLNGRWQGPSTYRLLIPQHHQAAIAERRQRARLRKQKDPSARRQHAIAVARQLARKASSVDQLVKLLDAERSLSDPGLHNLAYEEAMIAWQKLHGVGPP